MKPHSAHWLQELTASYRKDLSFVPVLMSDSNSVVYTHCLVNEVILASV